MARDYIETEATLDNGLAHLKVLLHSHVSLCLCLRTPDKYRDFDSLSQTP